MIRNLFRIAFFIYRNDHTCLPVFWCFFFKFSRPLTKLCQPTYSFSVQCLQHFRSDFVFFEHFYCLSCTWEYQDCKSDNDLFCNKTLTASFFARITSLESWFHQDVLFSLPTAILSHVCPQLIKPSLFRNNNYSVAIAYKQKSLKVVGILMPCLMKKLFPHIPVRQSLPFNVSHTGPTRYPVWPQFWNNS